MIDLEDAEVRIWIAIGEGVESGTEDDELSDSAADGEREFVFGEASADGHEGAHVTSRRGQPVGDSRERARHFASDDAHGKGVVEHLRAVKELVRGAASRDTQGSSAGAAFNHWFWLLVERYGFRFGKNRVPPPVFFARVWLLLSL